ncbi:F-box/LRR-repeat protein At5g63520 isoform X2 [Andrographis paniculata]|uniref:F-box/LRR-repeat protein At5g63520 isoform X2 n=1 Tax=Andrographis paniculata TaxID=175694 RepID=UPI0021E87B7B|nr:F-box/LRR-repeat protein At5g63520 isoform X2 [Andrographis paniculata]
MEQLSIGSLKRLGKAAKESQTGSGSDISGIDDLGDDLLLNVLRRLPAVSFASAACVNHSWNSLCNRILSSPKFASAISFNPSLENAVGEVIDKVLSEPIRPHFALASIGPSSSLEAALEQIDRKLGSRVPIIVNIAEGIIGPDISDNHPVEVQWELTEGEEEDGLLSPEGNVNQGILLTIGYLPGLKTFVLPFLFQHKVGPKDFHVDEFVMDIKKYTAVTSDTESPAGMILFAETDLKSFLQKFEYAFPKETFIVGDGGSRFLYKNDITTVTRSDDSTCAAVALVFSKDRRKPLGIGESEFHVMLSTGISPIGGIYKAVSVKCRNHGTWLTAARETDRLQLDGQTILDEIYDKLGDHIQYPAFYIGVTKRRRCSVGKGRVKRMEFHEFHHVDDANEEYLIVSSTGIQTGDRFRFYVSDSKAALSSSKKVTDSLAYLKQDCDSKNDHADASSSHCGKRQVFGGMIFSCCGRGTSFFAHPGIDSSPFSTNFPGIPFGGTYCAGEIARSLFSSYSSEDDREGCLVHCNQHVFSTVYLVMSYHLPAP